MIDIDTMNIRMCVTMLKQEQIKTVYNTALPITHDNHSDLMHHGVCLTDKETLSGV